MAAWKQTGKKPAQLDNPVPDGLGYIWDLYYAIKAGSDSVNHQSINNYLNITRQTINQFELECLILIEQQRIEVFSND